MRKAILLLGATDDETAPGDLPLGQDPKALSQEEYHKLRQRYRTILTRGAWELPDIPKSCTGSKRGRIICISGRKSTKQRSCASPSIRTRASHAM